MDRRTPIVTLTTDFGTREGYVGAMKGMMLGINPNLTLVDITHEVQGFDVMAAAFVMQQSLQYFHSGAVHLVVVDSGVGYERRAVALRHNDHYFVGPNNGLFALLLETETPDQVVELKVDKEQPLSSTFHGRDFLRLQLQDWQVGSHPKTWAPLLRTWSYFTGRCRWMMKKAFEAGSCMLTTLATASRIFRVPFSRGIL